MTQRPPPRRDAHSHRQRPAQRAPTRLVLTTLAAVALLPPLLASVALASATVGEVHGVVVAVGGGPIAGASVQASPGGSTTTDAAGAFALRGVPVGVVNVTAVAAGYAPGRVRATLAAGAPLRLQIALRPLAVKPSAETVKDKQREERAATAKRHKGGRAMVARGSGGYGAAVSRGYGVGGVALSGHATGYGTLRPMVAVGGKNQLEPSDREGYAHSAEEAFSTPADKPLSTFSLDVDSAAWANVRRFVEREHRRPPADAVRIEELVNAQPYAWPGPSDDHPFAVHTALTTAPWSPGHQLLTIAIQGRRIETRHLPPANLVFLLDVSGSMNSHDKLPLLKASLALLVRELRPEDKVSVVVYAGAAGLVLPPTSGADQATILAALDSLSAGGSTAGGAGIALAYQVAQGVFAKGGNNRVILCTDGDFNVGASSDGELVRIIEERRKSGIYLTVLGFGTGNYQDAKMQALAQHGNGNHAYIDSILEARRVLVEQMGGTLLTIAKDVKIQVEPNPRLVASYRLIGYDNRRLATRDFADDAKDAGELGAGHTVTALYEIVPRSGGEEASGGLRYSQAAPTAAAQSDELATVRLRYKPPTSDVSTLLSATVASRATPLAQASVDVRFATAAAELGLLLQGSKLAPAASFAALIARAKAALGADGGGHRAAFVRVAERAALLR